MVKKNDFELMCDEMKRNAGNRNKICKENPIICAKCLVEKYVHNDRDRLLKLKAETTGIAYHSFVSALSSLLGIALSFITIFISIFDIFDVQVKNYLIILLILWLGYIVVKMLIGMKAFSAVNKYGDYITVAINELEKEYKRV